MSVLAVAAAIVGALFGGGGLVALGQLILGRRKMRIEPMIDVQGAALEQMASLRIDMAQLRADRTADHQKIGRLERRVDQLVEALRVAQLPVPAELPDPIVSGGN